MRRRVAITFVLCRHRVRAPGRRGLRRPGPSSPARPARRCCARGSPSRSIARAPRPARSTSTSSACASRGQREGALLALAGGPGRGCDAVRLRLGLQPSGRRSETATWSCSTSAAPASPARCAAASLFVPVTRTPLEQAQAAERCAQSLGPRRAFYTTRDSVDDIDAVRRAVGVDKITLFGVSYGTKVALGYAARYPQHVERLRARLGRRADRARGLLPGEPRRGAARPPHAVRAGLRGDHARTCRGDLAALLSSMRGRAAVRAAGRRGRPAQARPDRPAAAPGAVVRRGLRPHSARRAARALRAAREGDTAPLLRLALRSERGAGPTPARYLSDALYTATVCEEGPLPWDRTTPVNARPAAAEANVRALPATTLGPFDRTTVLFGSAPFQLCSRWPTAPADPQLPDGPFPAVPTLVLAGEDDLRTPLESARRVASRIPGATLVTVPEMGHSVLSGFPRRCGLRAADDFFAGRPVRPCVARRRSFPPLPPFPRSLAKVQRRAAGRRQARPHGHGGRPDPGGRAGSAAERLAARGVRAERPARRRPAGRVRARRRGDARACTASCTCPACACAAGSPSATARTGCCG